MAWFVSFLFILIKGELLNDIILNYFEVDLVIILIAYLFTYYGDIGAGIFALGQGLLIDIFSAGLMGLFTFIYLIIFMVIKLVSRLFSLRSLKGIIIIISIAVIIKNILFVSLLYLFSLKSIFPFSFFVASVASAICSGLISPVLFYFFKNMDLVLMRIHEES